MPIHEKDKVRDDLLDDVYASSDLSQVMPKYKFPK
jgi:glutamate decarboxylase